MSGQRARQSDFKMRYFTPEMYLRLNSEHDAEVERAAKEWESAIARYSAS